MDFVTGIGKNGQLVLLFVSKSNACYAGRVIFWFREMLKMDLLCSLYSLPVYGYCDKWMNMPYSSASLIGEFIVSLNHLWVPSIRKKMRTYAKMQIEFVYETPERGCIYYRQQCPFSVPKM